MTFSAARGWGRAKRSSANSPGCRKSVSKTSALLYLNPGLIDIHDRKPLVLAPSLAREWLDPHLDPARAEEIAGNRCSPTEDFEWFRVGLAVGNVRYQWAQLITPLSATDWG